MKSPYDNYIYPNFHIGYHLDNNKKKSYILKSFIRIYRNEQYYLVPCEDRIFIEENDDVFKYIQKFIIKCTLIKELYILCGRETLDKSQISEEERLKNIII